MHDDGGTPVSTERIAAYGSVKGNGSGAPASGKAANGNGADGNGGWNGHGHKNGSGGHGVAGMAERAAAFGGTLQAGPAPAGGWEVMRDAA